jgi:hypothetical protein
MLDNGKVGLSVYIACSLICSFGIGALGAHFDDIFESTTKNWQLANLSKLGLFVERYDILYVKCFYR